MYVVNIQNVRQQLTETFNGQILESTSKKLKKFYEPFNAHRMSKFVARKWNKEHPGCHKSALDIQREWKEKAQKAIDIGKRVHSYAEQYPDFEEPICDKERAVLQWFEKNRKTYELVLQELGVYSDTFNFSGTLDNILLNNKTGNLVIIDWKTNADILKNYKGKKMFKPFDNLLDNPLNHYKLQLNHYKLLLESMTPFKVDKMIIIWLMPHKGKLYREFSVKDMTQKLKAYYGQY